MSQFMDTTRLILAKSKKKKENTVCQWSLVYLTQSRRLMWVSCGVTGFTLFVTIHDMTIDVNICNGYCLLRLRGLLLHACMYAYLRAELWLWRTQWHGFAPTTITRRYASFYRLDANFRLHRFNESGNTNRRHKLETTKANQIKPHKQLQTLREHFFFGLTLTHHFVSTVT